MFRTKILAISASSALLLTGGPALADPCGMVPPAWTSPTDTPIRRVGPQKTYVFHSDGIETMVLRPGFSGKVDQFGMLIPFPSPPAIRKVPDETFAHIQNAIDPPEIPLWVKPRVQYEFDSAPMMESGAVAKSAGGLRGKVKRKEVRVVSREALGMYEVAVLEAGSAEALKRWMEKQKFRYPEGMDKVINDYVDEAWCFVAVKAKVGAKLGVKPRAGMRRVNADLPQGAGFDGAVQAMGFRFKSKKLVIPMRLSAFNPGERRNVVYALSDRPKRLRGLDRSTVVRQVSGHDLVRNLTGSLPVRVMDGTVREVKQHHLDQLRRQRDPDRVLEIARELFASDLRAVYDGKLIHNHEKLEKKLLNISEELGLRGKEMDRQHKAVVEEEGEIIYEKTIKVLKNMTMTVIDADFPVDYVADQNLYFTNYTMKKSRNTAEFYDAKTMAGVGKKKGEIFWGTPRHLLKRKNSGWMR